MTDQQGLLYAILVDPFDDAPRLIYADWLDENGQSDRATLIRCQITIANLKKKRKWCDKHDRRPEPTMEQARGCRNCESVARYETDVHDYLITQSRLLSLKTRKDWFGDSGRLIERGFPYQIDGLSDVLRTKMPQAFVTWPITRVYLRDVTMVAAVGTEGKSDTAMSTYWFAPSREAVRAFPTVPFDKLTAHDHKTLERRLNTELVNYGRSLVGLPKLEFPSTVKPKKRKGKKS